MHLSKLSLVNFRNYQDISIDFTNSVNCLAGKNGAGKTNILEAVHYLSMTKGYFSHSDSLNIRHDSSMFIIQGEYEADGINAVVYCSIQQGQKKQFKVDKKEYEKLADHIGRFPIVVIAPTDQILVTGGSDIRRRFMDSIICQSDKSYLFNLLSYNQALLERNSLLKSSAVKGKVDRLSFDIWDERLASLAKPIYEQRKNFISKFQVLFEEYFYFISGEDETAGLEYKSHLNEDDMISSLKDNFNKDFDLGFTTFGIHKDDLVVKLNDYPVKRYASQGQQKSIVIALKLAQNGYLVADGFSKPIVLMDDIFDKLDDDRVDKLMKLVIEKKFGQLFVTDTSEIRLKKVFSKIGIPYKLFIVKNSSIHSPEEQMA